MGQEEGRRRPLKNKPGAQRRSSEPPQSASFPLRVPVWAFAVGTVAWLLWILDRDYERILRPFGAGLQDFARLLASFPAAFQGGLAWRLALVAAFWLCALAIGRGLASLLGLERGTRAENALFSAGLGAGALSLLLLLLGLTGLWIPWLLRIAMIAGAAAGILSLWFKRDAAPVTGHDDQRPGLWGALQTMMIVCAALAIVLGGATPETFYDSLAYHLSLPRLYLLHHRIMPLPGNVFSGPPMAMEMLYGLMLAFDDKGLTALLHGSFALATAAALAFLPSGRVPASVGRLAAMLFLLCPMTLYAGISSGADLGASFFVALAFFALLQSLEPEELSARMRWSVCAGLLAGLAMSTKYNAFSFGAVLILVRLWAGRKDGRALRESLAMAAAAFVVLSPWLLKNLFFFKNPVYPFLCELRPGSCPADWSGLLANAERRDLRATFLTAQGWKDYFLFAWTSCEGSLSMDNWPGSAFLMLAPWMLLIRWNSRQAKTAALAALGTYLAWSLASRTGRFLLPSMPILAYAGAFALENAAVPPALRACALAAVSAACAAGFLANAHQGMLGGRWQSLIEGTGRAEFLREEHPGYPSPSYAAFEFVNERLPSGAKVLLLGETRSFPLQRDFVSTSLFDDNPLWKIVRESRSGEDVRARLAAEGVTHILVNARGFYQGSTGVSLPADAVLSPAFNEFWGRWLNVVFEDRSGDSNITKWVLVYELRDRPLEKTVRPPLNPARIVFDGLAAPRR